MKIETKYFLIDAIHDIQARLTKLATDVIEMETDEK